MLKVKLRQYSLDSLSLSLITFQILVSTFLAVRYVNSHPYTSLVSLMYVILTISGLTLHHFFCGGVKLDKTLVKRELNNILLGVSLGFVLILLLQTLIFQAQTVGVFALATVLEAKLFYMCAGISEETFFRYYIQTKIEQSLPRIFISALSAVIVTSVLFTTYHFMVYRTELYALIAVFVSSLVLSTLYNQTKRLSVPMLIHSLVNLVAG